MKRLRIALLGGVLLSVFAAVPAVAASGTADAGVCVSAQRLTQRGLPGEALALIEATDTGQACQASARQAASTAVAEAASLVGLAQAAAEREDWQEAHDKAAEAVKKDQDNATAATLKATAGDELEAATQQTWAQRASARWDVTKERYADPLGKALLPAAVTLLALLVAARLLAVALPRWPRRGRVLWGVIGLLSGVAACLWLPLAGASAKPWPLAGACALALIAVLASAAWLATRLRLNIEVRGSDGTTDAGATGHVIALLAELAGGGAEGLEVPYGADLKALDSSAIMGTPEGRVAKLAAAAVQLVFNVTPWQVTVDQEDGGALSVHVTRNGHAASSAAIESRLVTADDGADVPAKPTDDEAAEKPTSPDLHRMAAAVVVDALAKKHKGFEGVCGATNWRSLGLHYLATVQVRDEKLKRILLARAVDVDSGNKLSQVAFRYEVNRHTAEPAKLKAYAEWLDGYAEGLGEKHERQLKRRVLHSALATWINHFYATHPDPHGAAPSDKLQDAGRALLDFYVQARQLAANDTQKAARSARHRRASAATDPLTAQSRPATASMLLWVDQQLPAGPTATLLDEGQRAALTQWLDEPTGPNGDYQVACYQASLDATGDQTALERLVMASQRPDLREWMTKDPQLKRLRETPRFRAEFFDDPRENFLELALLSPFAKTLEAMGVSTPRELALQDPVALSNVLGVGPAMAERMVVLGKIGSLAQGDLKKYRVELCAELLTLGRADTLADVGAAAAVDLHDGIEERCKTPPDQSTIQAWLDQFRLAAQKRERP